MIPILKKAFSWAEHTAHIRILPPWLLFGTQDPRQEAILALANVVPSEDMAYGQAKMLSWLVYWIDWVCFSLCQSHKQAVQDKHSVQADWWKSRARLPVLYFEHHTLNPGLSVVWVLWEAVPVQWKDNRNSEGLCGARGKPRLIENTIKSIQVWRFLQQSFYGKRKEKNLYLRIAIPGGYISMVYTNKSTHPSLLLLSGHPSEWVYQLRRYFRGECIKPQMILIYRSYVKIPQKWRTIISFLFY